ncbi:MAG TPA: hypothetical protein VEL82_06915 [Thermoplasmata archaeon]|nr:hypothetical protein [Thermoplasmata archaeon]
MAEDWAARVARRIAPLALRRSLGLRRGSSVVIEAWSTGLPIAEAIWLAARRLGIRPTLIVEPEESSFSAHRLTSAGNATAIGRADFAAVSAGDAYVSVLGPSDFRRLDALPRAARRALDERSREWLRRLHGLRIPKLVFFAPSALGADRRPAAVELGVWRREWERASRVPPAVLRRAARPWIRALRNARRLSIRHRNGTRLDLGLDGATPVLQDGVVDARDLAGGWMWTALPSGLLTVAVDGRRGDGTFVSNRPARLRAGSVEAIRWTFRSGRLVRHRAGRGAALFEERFRRAGRERTRPALISIGLNPAIHDLPLMEDQERDVLTLYLGHNDDFGGRTRGTFRMHASLLGAQIEVDGTPLVRA